jgi:hypothetical protein
VRRTVISIPCPNQQWLRELAKRKKKKSSSTSRWIGFCPPPAPPLPHPTTTILRPRITTTGTLATVVAALQSFHAHFRRLTLPPTRYGPQSHPPWRSDAADYSRTWVSPLTSLCHHLRPYVQTPSPTHRYLRLRRQQDQSLWRSTVTYFLLPLQPPDPNPRGM